MILTLVLGLDHLIGSLLSSKAVEDLQKLNPYFEQGKIAHVYDILIGTILHSNRAGQINRALSDARDLLGLLQSTKSKLTNPSALLAGLIQKSESLAVNLATQRYFMDSEKDGHPAYGMFTAVGRGVPLMY